MDSADSEIVIGSTIGVIIFVALLALTVILSSVIIAKRKGNYNSISLWRQKLSILNTSI